MNPIISLIQLIVILGLAPLTMGLVRLFKARLQGRRGANPFLPYFMLATLLRKQMVISTSTSWIFRLAPFMVLGSTIFLALILPLLMLNGSGNLFVVSGVLMIGAIFLVLGGLDSASAFGGMGASREMTIAALVEPAMIMTLAGLAVITGSSDINGMLTAHITIGQAPYIILTFGALVMITLAENARYPVDNPATHLELTMVHEAMILEYSGPYLAMLEFASFIKITIFALLVSNFIWPSSLMLASSDLSALLIAIIWTVAKLIVVMALLAILESVIAKMRFYRMQEYLTGAFFLAAAGMIMTLIAKYI